MPQHIIYEIGDAKAMAVASEVRIIILRSPAVRYAVPLATISVYVGQAPNKGGLVSDLSHQETADEWFPEHAWFQTEHMQLSISDDRLVWEIGYIFLCRGICGP
jgi:hypothetical protein